ncbi:MAG TPA: hypothetical protein VGE07_20800, partial [Herpetosiphonaceae bacterium]
MERRIFRQVALERLSSPEQLDHLLAIAPPRSWAALVAVLLLLIAGLAWGATARIATTATARGVLLGGDQLQAPL